MKKYFVALCFLCVLIFSIHASSLNHSEETRPFPIEVKGNEEKPVLRAPASGPIYGSYDPDTNEIYFYFRTSLGILEYQVNNVNTGDFLSGTINGAAGVDVICISGSSGLYTVLLTDSEGNYYTSYFLI